MTQRILITAALPYVNNAPHLGNIIGCVLSADVFARFCRARGYETRYICGTDGYGTATETKAKAEGMTPREICEKYHEIHSGIYKYFNIAFDAFGKTFSSGHSEVVQGIYHRLEAQGALEEQITEQAFCEACAKFLADRYVEGTCPSCQSDQARGDQCDACGKLLNPLELKNPRCTTCGGAPIAKTTKHLYLKLPELAPELMAWQDKASKLGHWTHNSETTTKSWFKQGLNPRPITRDLKWGVPVPRPGYEDKVFYVWFDAPIGYISITKEFFPDDWQDWWLTPDTTKLYQFIGKDNIPFHSVIFPACLLGTGDAWTMLHHLNSTEFLNYENMKFSKSRNIGIFGTDVMDLDFPVDFWRFYLLAVRPEKQDANFLWNEFVDKINSELIDNLGNLVNRVLVYSHAQFPGPLGLFDYQAPEYQAHRAFIAEVRALTATVTGCLEKSELREALRNILLIGNAGNRFFHEQEPWKKIKVDRHATEATIALLVHVIRNLGIMLAPYVPDAAGKILAMTQSTACGWDCVNEFADLAGKTLGPVTLLFEKIDPKRIPELKARFGSQTSGFDKLDIRVGKVLAVTNHPTAGHLYVEKIDVGDPEPLVVVSALKTAISPEDLLGLHVLVVVNLAPCAFGEVTSQSMVLVAQHRKKLELLQDATWPVGARLYREHQCVDSETSSLLKPAIDFAEFQTIALAVADGIMRFDNLPIHVDGRAVRTRELLAGKVK